MTAKPALHKEGDERYLKQVYKQTGNGPFGSKVMGWVDVHMPPSSLAADFKKSLEENFGKDLAHRMLEFPESCSQRPPPMPATSDGFKKKQVDETFVEERLVDIISQWKHAWMNVRGTDERDQMNYYTRAFGVDANMKYDLARRLLKAFKGKSDV